jgi:hypothetical protein
MKNSVVWINVNDELPVNNEVLAVYINTAGKERIVRARYYRKFERDLGSDLDDSCPVDYNEDDDTYYIAEGWYELIDNWDDYYSVCITEGDVSYWTYLPLPPKESFIVGQICNYS